MRRRFLSATVLALLPLTAASAQVSELVVHPESVVLDGPRSRQSLVVLAKLSDGRTRDVTKDALVTVDDAKVVVATDGLLSPVGDGKAAATVTVAGLKRRIPITVRNFTKEEPVSFVREVEPILTKAGCNSGACHGAQHGRGGFRLSLFGFDPAFDHAQIVQSNEGRRVVPSDPERSILLAKPSLVMEHGGGERLKHRSREYETIRRWLEDGAPEPGATAPIVAKLTVFPPARVAQVGETQQLAVTATWSDGRVEDVTPVPSSTRSTTASPPSRRTAWSPRRPPARRTSWSASAARPPSRRSRCPSPASTSSRSCREQLHRRD